MKNYLFCVVDNDGLCVKCRSDFNKVWMIKDLCKKIFIYIIFFVVIYMYWIRDCKGLVNWMEIYIGIVVYSFEGLSK